MAALVDAADGSNSLGRVDLRKQRSAIDTCSDYTLTQTGLSDSVKFQIVLSSAPTFVALKAGGAVVTWGYPHCGGDSTAVREQLMGGVVQIHAGADAFAAVKENGKVVAWGDC